MAEISTVQHSTLPLTVPMPRALATSQNSACKAVRGRSVKKTYPIVGVANTGKTPSANPGLLVEDSFCCLGYLMQIRQQKNSLLAKLNLLGLCCCSYGGKAGVFHCEARTH